MDLLNKLFDIARQRNRKIVLPEGDDERIIAAAARLAREKIASPILLGHAQEITRIAGQHDVSLSGIEIADPPSDVRLQGYGSAIAVVFFALIVALAGVLLHLRSRTLWTEIGSGA